MTITTKIVKCQDCKGTGKIKREYNLCRHKWAWWRNDEANCDFYLCEKCGSESHAYDCYCGAMGNARKQIMNAKTLDGRSYSRAEKDIKSKRV